jgi:hypothetical protein
MESFDLGRLINTIFAQIGMGGCLSGIVAVILLVSFLRTQILVSPYKAHRIYDHSYAYIIEDDYRAGLSQIEITNVDTRTMDDLHRRVGWSGMASRVKMPDGTTWRWRFRYMGDGKNENYLDDPTHKMYMNDALAEINEFLDKVINPAKDRDREENG